MIPSCWQARRRADAEIALSGRLPSTGVDWDNGGSEFPPSDPNPGERDVNRAAFACRVVLPCLAVAGLVGSASEAAPPVTDVEALRSLAARLDASFAARRAGAYQELLRREPARGVLPDGAEYELLFVSARGEPFWYATENVNAAATVNTNLVHPGGGFGFSLTGSSTPVGQLAVWDGGAVRASHDELVGRVIQVDGYSSYSSHSTHVAGTMIGEGVDADAKGMSYQGQLDAYQWNNDSAEMASAAAAGLRVSNHSYGFVTGWRFGYTDPSEWNWFGDLDVSPDEDYGFGFYSSTAAEWDQIAYDAPYYLIVASAGNDRNDYGPGAGAGHYHWDNSASQWVWATDTHEPDGGTDGYDSVSWTKTAKNLLAVGAIEDIPAGWTAPGDVVMSSFSGWGPTDDGRIKPDLVANGVSLYSCTAGSDGSYSSYSGTSMASPNLSGSMNLLVDYFRETHGNDPLASTLKAILVQTANEAGGAAGPDYEHGWGLLNLLGAAQLVQADSAESGHILEAVLADGAVDSWAFTLASPETVRVTLAWTDPPGPESNTELNPTELRIVNDLDLRVRRIAVSHEPWVLDPANPADPAATGDNFRDVTEQVFVANLPAGDWFVEVSHKGSLHNGLDQAYSLASSVALYMPAVGAEETLRTAGDRPTVRPNPFRDATTVSFRLAERTSVHLEVFDVRGRLVRRLEDGAIREAGTHRVTWDGRDERGRALPAGVYFSRLRAGEVRSTEKLVLLRSE